MKFYNLFNKSISKIFSIMLIFTIISSSTAFANDIKSDELVSRIEQLLIDAQNIGVEVTEVDSSSLKELTKDEMIDIISLLNFAIESHTTVKDNASKKLAEDNSIINNSDNQHPLIEPYGTNSISYICRAGIKYTTVSGTVPVDGISKQVTANVAVYARWAYKEYIDTYTGTTTNTFYKANQYYGSKGTTVSIGNLKNFTQNTIGIERATNSGFYVVGTGTYTINYKFLTLDFFVPFSQYFSIFDGSFQYETPYAPF